MRLYLVQHGKAKSKEEDPDRPLSDQGINESRQVAEFANQHLELMVSKIFHSGKTRARQTAELLTGIIKSGTDSEKADRLEPMADPSIWANKLNSSRDNIMLIGHLPHLSRLTSLLLTGTQDKAIVNFRNSGIVCLERDDNNNWGVTWILTPEILK